MGIPSITTNLSGNIHSVISKYYVSLIRYLKKNSQNLKNNTKTMKELNNDTPNKLFVSGQMR